MHPVFHVSLLKLWKGPVPDTVDANAVPLDHDKLPEYQVDRILAHRTKSRSRQLQTEYLVRWSGLSEEHASWELSKNLSQTVIDDYWHSLE